MRLAGVALLSFLSLSTLGGGNANAGAVDPDFPDFLICTYPASPGHSGPALFQIVMHQTDDSKVRYIIDSIDNSGTQVSSGYLWNSDGTFSLAINVGGTTTCDNKTMSELRAEGAAIDLAIGSSFVPAGAFIPFNLTECPGGWTQHLQLMPVASAEQPMIYCRKD